MPVRVDSLPACEHGLVGLDLAAGVEVCLVPVEGAGVKLIFGCPTYGPTESRANRTMRAAIMHAAANGHEWLGDASPERQKHDAARNNVVQSVIHDEANADASVFWCDSDVILPVEAITRLASWERDFITGIYFQREKPYWPLIANYNPHGGKDRAGSMQWVGKWPENALAPIDGCGFGCVLTSVRMLRAIEAPWFEFRKFSEDFDFCMKAREKGYQLYVDTGVLCGHLREPEEVTFDTYREAHPELFGGDDGSVRSGAA